MKTVCVIGAGPSGLVAARKLLQYSPQQYDVTIFERSEGIGGMWPLHPDDHSKMLDPQMPTNLSRYTVAFSDFAWESVELGNSKDGSSVRAPTFPKAWQVGRYLEGYRKTYIPHVKIVFNTRVDAVRRAGTSQVTWEISWRNLKEDTARSTQFDHVVVSSGFYFSPKLRQYDRSTTRVPILHSSRLRDLGNHLQDLHAARENKNLVVIGGGMSGAEAAASIAMQISSSRWSVKASNGFERYQVYHVHPKPFYCLPSFIPVESQGADKSSSPSSFLPLDLRLYDLSRRLPGPIQAISGRMPAEKAATSHGFLRSFTGGDQHDLGAESLVADEHAKTKPCIVAISDTYPEFVRARIIKPLLGRATIEGSDVNVIDGQREIQLKNVAGVIYANGYTPQNTVRLFSEEILDILEYDKNCQRLPLLLHEHSTSHPHLSNLGFVGFYEGPYWGVMEMQARDLAIKWRDTTNGSLGIRKINCEDETEKLRELRQDIKDGNNIPQYWMGDYIGVMEDFARKTNIQRDDEGFPHGGGPVTPARYVDGAGNEQATIALLDLHNTLSSCMASGRYLARATFRAMQGRWSIRRTLKSALPCFPSGVLTGTAHLHPRYPTDVAYDFEYLYIEEGDLTTEQGFTLKASRRYVYRYQESTDKITVWFVKDDGLSVDYLFNEMDFQLRNEDDVGAKDTATCVSKASHLCVEDLYNSVYNFRLRGWC